MAVCVYACKYFVYQAYLDKRDKYRRESRTLKQVCLTHLFIYLVVTLSHFHTYRTEANASQWCRISRKSNKQTHTHTNTHLSAVHGVPGDLWQPATLLDSVF